MPPRPLDGLVVLELGQVYNGPYCALLLAHLGAEVIKIEPPVGEPARHRAGADDALPFLMLNAGKRGVRLDLKTAAGRALFLRLAATCDVVIENYRAGTLEKLGIGYETLSGVNPRLVLGSGRGFARGGPYADLPAMDLTVQAMTGVLAATGFPEQPPVKAGAAVADFLGGVHLLAGVLAALLEREKSGRGQVVEVAMQDALLPALASNLGALFQAAGTVRAGAVPERTGNRHGGLAICPYNVYRTLDGWVALFCATDRQWLALCEVMARPDLAADEALRHNNGRVAHMDELDGVVEAWTAARSRAECVGAFAVGGIPAAPVLSLAEVAADPQIEASGMLQTAHHPRHATVRVLGSPLNLSRAPRRPLSPAPGLGEHTRPVLKERLGLSDEDLERLTAEGVI